jgi:hypothetical protein
MKKKLMSYLTTFQLLLIWLSPQGRARLRKGPIWAQPRLKPQRSFLSIFLRQLSVIILFILSSCFRMLPSSAVIISSFSFLHNGFIYSLQSPLAQNLWMGQAILVMDPLHELCTHCFAWNVTPWQFLKNLTIAVNILNISQYAPFDIYKHYWEIQMPGHLKSKTTFNSLSYC